MVEHSNTPKVRRLDEGGSRLLCDHQRLATRHHAATTEAASYCRTLAQAAETVAAADCACKRGLNVRGVEVGCYPTSNRFGRYGAANDKDPCTRNETPLILSWERIPRLDSGVRVNHESTNIDLLSMCSRKIGNGVHTRFWEDIWCGDQPFRLRFPRIFLLEIDRECLVANQIHLSDWSSVLRRALRGGAESSQFDSLLAAIGDVDLSDQRDSWKWSLHASVGFSVASVRSPRG
ncbi:hypothetical protein Tco_1354379 [Tanacetum coccineum]